MRLPEKASMFFSEKKNQKIFIPWLMEARCQADESLFASVSTEREDSSFQ
jgi:hypothetical protein